MVISRMKASVSTVAIESDARAEEPNGTSFDDKWWEYEAKTVNPEHKINMQTQRH